MNRIKADFNTIKKIKSASLGGEGFIVYFDNKDLSNDVIVLGREISSVDGIDVDIIDFDYESQPKACAVPIDISEAINFWGPVTIFMSKAIVAGILAGVGNDIYKKIKSFLINIKNKKLYDSARNVIIRYGEHVVIFRFFDYFDEEDIDGAIENIPIFLQNLPCGFEEKCRIFTVGHPQHIVPLFDTKRKIWVKI